MLFRSIFARIGRTFSPISGEEVKCNTINDVMSYVLEGEASAAYILADLQWSGRDDKVELMLALKEEGYSRLFTDKAVRIEDVMKHAQDGDYPEDAFLLVDRLRIPRMKDGLPVMEDGTDMSQTDWDDLNTRLHASVDTAFSKGNGTMYVLKEPVQADDARQIGRAHV